MVPHNVINFPKAAYRSTARVLPAQPASIVTVDPKTPASEYEALRRRRRAEAMARTEFAEAFAKLSDVLGPTEAFTFGTKFLKGISPHVL